MSREGISLSTLLITICASTHYSDYRRNLKNDLGQHPDLKEWILDIVQSMYEKEMQDLSDKAAGLHMSISRMRAEQLEASRISMLKVTFQQKAPILWKAIHQLLNTDGKQRRQRKYGITRDAMVTTEVGGELEEQFGDNDHKRCNTAAKDLPLTEDHHHPFHLDPQLQ
ncbi:uncharacterized protein EI90DRAFT_3126422 [Cantharellus anzutake]|uniref:uncharacterized protein n=1 Tax=Cantharellus anzutake TaxID=1750568 RepID=UPI001905F84C|nr:uncharacterized protein EI90DRAFT_3126422 [Cantharellus anzutake]KAF8328254.1 hypothetical protein EI90DRAFT_3126422 [Cantharellus anzutake]